ncbi:MAG: ester cyclase [Chloroflexota bacterium]
MSAQENAKIARIVYEKFNSRDFEGAVAYVAANYEGLNVPLGTTLHGPDGFRQFMQGWATAFPDSRVEVTNLVAGEEGVVVEFRGRGTHTGPLIGPTGEIPATGREVNVSFCDVLRIENSKITSIHTYYDAATMMGQLGLMG